MLDAMKVEELEPKPAVSMRFECVPRAVASNLEKILPLIRAYSESRGGVISGPAFVRYHAKIEGQFYLEAGFPVSEGITPNSLVDMTELPGGLAVVTEHEGPRRELGSLHREIREWIRGEELSSAGPAWDSYLNGINPEEGEVALTRVVYPVNRG